MGDAGIAQLHISAVIVLPVDSHHAVQVDDRGIVEPYAVAPGVDALPHDKARRGFHALDLPCQSFFKAVAADAARAVAAHLAETAVLVVKAHPEIPAIFRRDDNHHAVRPDAGVRGTELLGQRREPLLRELRYQVVYDHEVVSGPVHFGDLHGLTPTAP